MSMSRSSAGSRAEPASASATGCGSTSGVAAPMLPVCVATASVGSTSISPSTTTAVSTTPRCSPTRKQPLRPPSCVVLSASTAATASVSSESSPTTAPPTSLSCTRSPASDSGSNINAHGPTGHRRTAKQNASSAPCSPAGPTAPSTAQATNAPPHLTAGSGTTTIADDTQPSATKPPSPEPTCLGLTPRKLRRKLFSELIAGDQPGAAATDENDGARTGLSFLPDVVG